MKKGSMSLSVNAIVIFVLAFAMLGFGLFIIQKLQSNTDALTDTAFNLDSFSNPPTSQKPIVFTDTLKFKPSGTKNLGIGIYNSGGTISKAHPEFVSCTGTLAEGKQNSQVIYQDKPQNSETYIFIETLNTEIKISESVALPANIITNGLSVGNFICEIGVFDGNNKLFTQQIEVIIAG